MVGLALDYACVTRKLADGGVLLVAEAVVPAAEQVGGRVEPYLRHLRHA